MRKSSIGLQKSLWEDDDRYIKNYWDIIQGVWVHGILQVEIRMGIGICMEDQMIQLKYQEKELVLQSWKCYCEKWKSKRSGSCRSSR